MVWEKFAAACFLVCVLSSAVSGLYYRSWEAALEALTISIVGAFFVGMVAVAVLILVSP